ncbi:MAG: hypothetical protein HN441_01625, partial [Candidatus Thioglobus sp.]|nr:hypothetical protein [Candidatus Thioglobus sp.]
MKTFINKLKTRKIPTKDLDILSLLYLTVMTAFIWMWLGTLDIVSLTSGSVVPSSQVKTIQHLEGGIVSKIYIEEGQRVLANQPLLDLESTDSKANVGEMLVRLATLTVKMARLRAESNGSEVIIFLSEVEKRTPKLVQQ